MIRLKIFSWSASLSWNIWNGWCFTNCKSWYKLVGLFLTQEQAGTSSKALQLELNASIRYGPRSSSRSSTCRWMVVCSVIQGPILNKWDCYYPARSCWIYFVHKWHLHLESHPAASSFFKFFLLETIVASLRFQKPVTIGVSDLYTMVAGCRLWRHKIPNYQRRHCQAPQENLLSLFQD